MKSERLPRQLAAILYADVVGFSRMTEMDEEGTFLKVREYLEYFAESIEAYNGRVIKYAGDAVLATFNSATDALLCAAQVQTDVSARNIDEPEERKIYFRIGLNLGDVIEDRGDVFGDGVNIAARLEALSLQGGICISESIRNAVGMKLPFDFEFMGEQQVKNISKPVRAYHAKLQDGAVLPNQLRSEDRTGSKAERNIQVEHRRAVFLPIGISVFAIIVVVALWLLQAEQPEQALAPMKQSLIQNQQATEQQQQKAIIVLPFHNMSKDPEQDYFADGITEDIITDLSRLSGLQVLARNTSFSYKGHTVNPQQIGQELNVTHLLEGSVRKAGERLRINVQLINTQTSRHIWAERYDRNLADVFAVQDEVNRNIVRALAVHLTLHEKNELAKDTTADFAAYDLFLQGQKVAQERTEEANQQAQGIFREVIKIDPSYARAYGALAVQIMYFVNDWWSQNPIEKQSRALTLARKAIALDNQSPYAFWALGFTHLLRQEYVQAAEAARQSTLIAPNYADGYALQALVQNCLGEPEKALKLMNEAMSLNPHYSWEYLYNLGHSYYIQGNYERAAELFRQSLERNENAKPSRLVLVASYVALKKWDEVEWEVEEVLHRFPDTSLSSLGRNSFFAGTPHIDVFLEHMRQTSLSE